MAGSRFGRTLVEMFRQWRRALPISLSSYSTQVSVRSNEHIATFVKDKRNINKTDGVVRSQQVMPRWIETKKRFETSVCRCSGIDEERIWRICCQHFDRHIKEPAIGLGSGRASIVFDVGLSFDPDGVPYPEHVNIVGWQVSAARPREESKGLHMNQAQKIAAELKYSPRPEGR